MRNPSPRGMSRPVLVQAGQAAAPVTSAKDALAAMRSLLAYGDARLSLLDWDGAVEGYKVAGSLGVSTVGPAVDRETDGRSKDATQKAWALNASLAVTSSTPFNATPARPSDAVTAQKTAQKMLSLYEDAMPSWFPGGWFGFGAAAAALGVLLGLRGRWADARGRERV